MTTQATPRPWTLSKLDNGQLCIRTAEGGLVATLEAGYDQTREEHGNRIVTAVNSYDATRLSLQRLTEKVERANSLQHSGGTIDGEDWSELYQLTNEAKAALALAKGDKA